MSELKPREESAAEGAPFAPRVEQPLAPRAEQPLAFREDLPVPEPWGRTIWEVVKPLPLSIGMMYGMMYLLMPGEGMSLSWYLQMGGVFAVMGVFRRRKGQFHSHALLPLGGVLLAAATIIGAIGFTRTDATGLTMGVVFGVFGGIVLFAGFQARTLERERAARLNAESDASVPIEGAMPVATLRSRVQKFKDHLSRANKRLFAGFASVIGLTMGSLTFGERLGLTDGAYLGVFLAFWAGLGGMMWYTSHITKRAARDAELECPACRRPLVSTLGSQRLMAQLEDLGRCPQCAARITVEVL